VSQPSVVELREESTTWGMQSALLLAAVRNSGQCVNARSGNLVYVIWRLW